jgi:glycosyltransferase involved in cell wall biosynthesis
MKPVITIGICVRNGERVLRNAFDSIINQDFPQDQIQVIVVDDGSKDATPKIISAYASKFGSNAKFFQTSWGGLGHARNLVINQADGKFILWLDSDEILTKSYVSKQVSIMKNNPRVGITSGVFKMVPGNIILNLELIPFIVIKTNYKKPRNFIWKTEKLIGTGGSTFRVEALKQVNGFNEAIKGAGEDLDIALRIRKAGWLTNLNDGEFFETHNGMFTFAHLWSKYVWYGNSCQKMYRENREIFSIARMSPLAGLITGFLFLPSAYLLLHQKKVFLLPIHYGLKMTAWMSGFIKGQIHNNEE